MAEVLVTLGPCPMRVFVLQIWLVFWSCSVSLVEAVGSRIIRNLVCPVGRMGLSTNAWLYCVYASTTCGIS